MSATFYQILNFEVQEQYHIISTKYKTHGSNIISGKGVN